MNRSDTVILVTGSNGGIGSGVVRHLLEVGYRKIACQCRNSSDAVQKVLAEHGLDRSLHLFDGDLTAEAYLPKLQKEISERLGDVDAVVNLAGGSTNGVSWKLSLEDFQRVLAMNLTTAFLTCRQFVPRMREKGSGRIINTSSVVGFKGAAGAAHYGAAKAAVAGFTKSLSLELAGKGVTANTMALGYFDVGIIRHVPADLQKKFKEEIPAGRFGTAKEVGGLVAYLLSDEAQYLTGQVFHINGGLY